MFEYYKKVAAEKPHLNLHVESMPAEITAEYTKSLNDKPGILALAMKKTKREDGTVTLEGIPFCVPGARFNELYNWDSYFISLLVARAFAANGQGSIRVAVDLDCSLTAHLVVDAQWPPDRQPS